jgi:hypothetical protein
MLKIRLKKFSKSLISASLTGLAVFAVFGLALYTYAQVVYPATQPGSVSGVVGLYVGQTAAQDGNDPGSYQNANSLCANGGGALANSHVCTPMEVVNTYNHNPSALPGSGIAWVNSGAPSNSAQPVNDCRGWSSNGLGNYANVWNFSINSGGMQPCAQSYSIACCK